MKKQTDAAALEQYRKEHDRCLGIATIEFRTEKGLSQSEVAKRALVSVLWIQRLETNELHTDYTIRRLDQVAGALGIELYDLYKRVSEMMGPPPWLKGEGTQNDE
ncbi:helix-turn-helix transcriptional regulator [Granulicella sp. dw_53]|uniref:helix-turn-helix domain-containing protein n=1 Tax=Granulicella sp. dw_53 TaxID=2719792 RepID=UPI001BD6C922|nr:helix-turn-helix transcriptional regulator [Granulicella sp. dw_53]